MTTLHANRRLIVRLGTAMAALLVCAAVAAAQTPSLAELAKKEQERRKATASATKVVTNKDLPKPKTPAAESPATLPPPAPPLPDAKPDDRKAQEQADQDKPARDETYWRTRMTSLREELRRNEMFMEALQSRINALSTDFVNRDDPFQRAKIAEDRQKALSELERVKSDIDKSTKAIADLEEEARQAGVPPGWLR